MENLKKYLKTLNQEQLKWNLKFIEDIYINKKERLLNSKETYIKYKKILHNFENILFENGIKLTITSYYTETIIKTIKEAIEEEQKCGYVINAAIKYIWLRN